MQTSLLPKRALALVLILCTYNKVSSKHVRHLEANPFFRGFPVPALSWNIRAKYKHPGHGRYLYFPLKFLEGVPGAQRSPTIKTLKDCLAPERQKTTPLKWMEM
eukprot:GHVT01045966.1.p1 GENE.GHVT01045966.1~~GHVT01045966.1.p1  ORF type:complete len:104 (-),score=3.27 GHVT01045966.1:1089-1400(-)